MGIMEMLTSEACLFWSLEAVEYEMCLEILPDSQS